VVFKENESVTLSEVEELRDDLISAAVRAKKCGYDGVEVHGAHGYSLTQFLSSDINRRIDEYGGSLENRSRLLFEIVEGIRESCGRDFLLGVRLSPERFGMDLIEAKETCERLIGTGNIDFLDISLWDCSKLSEDEKHQDRSRLQHFTELERNDVKLTVAGKIRSGKDVQKVLDAGVDFVTIGRSAILRHDFPLQVIDNQNFETVETPVSKEYLRKEGLGDAFIEYMGRWPDFTE
jgi:2,4-dienoyl-CoA reductase-like NADH-dependent reductase (Old Yellow Enzyme family)